MKRTVANFRVLGLVSALTFNFGCEEDKRYKSVDFPMVGEVINESLISGPRTQYSFTLKTKEGVVAFSGSGETVTTLDALVNKGDNLEISGAKFEPFEGYYRVSPGAIKVLPKINSSLQDIFEATNKGYVSMMGEPAISIFRKNE